MVSKAELDEYDTGDTALLEYYAGISLHGTKLFYVKISFDLISF